MEVFSRRRSLVGILALVVALTAAACGDDKKDNAASSSTTAGGSTETTAAAGTPATGEPIVVGFTNLEGGAISLPEVRLGAETAVNYINKYGGVNNRPLKLIRCDVDGSPEKSVDCGNKFVQGKAVAALEGVDVGADAMLPILKSAGIPLFGHVPFGPQQRAALGQAFFFGAAVPAYGAAELQTAKDQGLTNAALFLADLPSSHAYESSVLPPTGQKLGVKVKVIYYDAANPDWTTIVTTALAGKPDTVGSPAAQESDCVGFIKAARAAGYTGNIFGAACSAFIPALGAGAVGVQTYSDLWNPTVTDVIPAAQKLDVKTYTDAMTASGNKDKIVGFAAGSFSDTMNFSKILKGINGTIDGKSITAALQGTKNFSSFMGTNITCDGTAWKGETSCGTGVLIYEVTQGGARKLVSKGYLSLGQFAPQ